MDNDSPFAGREVVQKLLPSGIVHVNFCKVCHHVWKAPAEATTCINCKGQWAERKELGGV